MYHKDDNSEDTDGRKEDDLIVLTAVLELPIGHYVPEITRGRRVGGRLAGEKVERK